MDLKTKIGNRITQARKALGITIKELAARTGSLSAARISNWEQCTRSPGPLEAKLLADQLNISASYLLCLTDNPQGELRKQAGFETRLIPVLPFNDVIKAKDLMENSHSFDFDKVIAVDSFNRSKDSECLFAVSLPDNSMQPDINQGDLVIVDTELTPKPGDFVLAYLTEKNQTVLRRYREAEEHLFQLLASNELWTTINIKNSRDVIIIGVVCERRVLFNN
jgi:SOS-response transcriptional repressor LexA